MEVVFVPVTKENVETYITVGIKSYKEHYLHLWKNQDPAPFINAFLKKSYVLKALKSNDQLFYLIKVDGTIAGILNMTLNAKKGFFLSKENILLNKIYLLKTYSAMGIGSASLKLIEDLAKTKKKDVVFLYAMKKGNPLRFYTKHNYSIIKEAFIELPNILENEKEMWLMAKKI